MLAGGLITLPQWIVSCGISDSPTHQTFFSQAEQELISSVVDTIIPAGNPIAIGSTGALSVGVDKYLIKLIDDCFEKDVQDNVKAQLKAFSRHLLNHRIINPLPIVRRRSGRRCCLKLSSSNNKAEKDFFDLIKSETIRGFNTSQKVMEHLGYKVAPGHYYGCVDVKA